MTTPYIHFIINPVSGGGKHNINVQFIKEFFPSHQIIVDYTQYKGHAMLLTKAAMENNPYCIVACGGDGTINEVASCLVHSNIALGIVPVGSGNGLASHLNIPKEIDKAMQVISIGRTIKIDAGKANHYYFFSNMGIAIDALIIKKYERASKKSLMSYVWSSLTAALEYRPAEALVKINGESIWINPMLLLISNSNEMGYNMSLTPNASLTDGKLDVFMVPKINFLKKVQLGIYIITGKIDKFKKARTMRTTVLDIALPKKIFIDAQIDGEYQFLKTNKVYVTIIRQAITVLV
ncbi:diacylglycerol/lipid kinase family protein [Flavobacterium fluviatile]|uniref:diacylglycerol/lipid kinase family protein n=1 Tax=Flavobacterium fluviatile TaxID=1862387 RepID=UPI0013D6F82B|nr:diacylglycerol kinase family protein [Flavobacterium fluviatile]